MNPARDIKSEELQVPDDHPLSTQAYVVGDDYFGAPYVDADEWRTTLDEAHRYRFVHGGFAGTDTRFACYFPPAEQWRERLLFPVEGGLGGYEDTCETIQGFILDQLGIGFRLGAYVVESNAGHIGVELDAKAGPDPTIYGHRAHAESARLSKHLAEQVYGRPPRCSIAYGGGGGGMRAQLCLENTDVFDAALAYVGVAEIADAEAAALPASERVVRSATTTRFGNVLNVHRLLGAALPAVVDAVEPGGSGDPFDGLNPHQREELAALYRNGFPRGSEVLISEPVGAVSVWAWMAESMLAEAPDYFRAFWSDAGYVGHDSPEYCAADVVEAKVEVKRVVTAAELAVLAEGMAGVGSLAKFMVGMKGADYPCAVEVHGPVEGHLIGASVTIASGASAGRSLYVGGVANGVWYLDGAGEAGTARLAGVEPGDELHVDNHDFLAFCYAHRHHMTTTEQQAAATDRRPMPPQHPLPRSSALLGIPASGDFAGKLLLMPGTGDSNVWPSSAQRMMERIADVQGAGAADRVRLRFMEHAENLPGSFIPSMGGPAMGTRFIDYNPLVEQSLHDLVAWVEQDEAPHGTSCEFVDGQVVLPPDADLRGGIQAVVQAFANGGVRADVSVGEPVTMTVAAQLPAGAGAVVSVAWDFDGSGTFSHELEGFDGRTNPLTLTTGHTYETQGVYFPAVRVKSHRDGDASAQTRLIPNLGRVRVVVT